MSSQPSAAFSPDLRAALIAMVRKRVPESEVEDIVQSTLADAIESPHAPTDSESLRRWIFGVAKNKVVDYHRRAGRETFDIPEHVAGKPAPHQEADLLRWAEKHLPPGEENKTTLDWMLREGEGEKLEWIAETEKVPAPRVRQRVSRLRRHLKTHWQKEVALLATLGVLMTILLLVLKKKEPEPIANENLPRAAELRKVGLEQCAAADWKNCVEKLDQAKQLDPAGDTRPEVRRARDDADKALSTPPTTPSSIPTTENTTAPPLPTPPPESSDVKGMKEAPPLRKTDGLQKPTPSPMSTEPAPTSSFQPPPPPSPKSGKPQSPSKMKGGSSSLDGFDNDSFASGIGTGAPPPPSKTALGSGSKSAATKKEIQANESKKKDAAMANKASTPFSKTTVPSVNVKPMDTFTPEPPKK